MSARRHVLSFYFIFITSLPFPISNSESRYFVFLLKSYFLFFALKWLNLYCLLVWKHVYRYVCIFVCLKKILKHQNTRKLYICLKIRMFGTLHTCMFVYLKAGCSVFAILSGWYQQNECLLPLKHVRLITCLLSCFYASSNIKFLKRINCLQTRLHICLHVCMFACLYVCYNYFDYFLL